MSVEGLKVALVFDDSLDHPSGVGQYVRELAQGLSRLGAKPTFLVGQTSEEQIAGIRVCSMSRNVAVRSNGGAGTTPLPASGRAVAAALEEGGFDLVHVQMPYSPLMAGRIISELRGRRSVDRDVPRQHRSPAGADRRPVAWPRLSAVPAALRPDGGGQRDRSPFGATDARPHKVDAIIPNMVDVARFWPHVATRGGHHGPTSRLPRRTDCAQGRQSTTRGCGAPSSSLSVPSPDYCRVGAEGEQPATPRTRTRRRRHGGLSWGDQRAQEGGTLPGSRPCVFPCRLR